MIRRMGAAWLAVSLTALTCVGLVGVVHWRLLTYERPASAALIPYEDRPAKCSVYYQDGTNRWKDCMGVGYVPY